MPLEQTYLRDIDKPAKQTHDISDISDSNPNPTSNSNPNSTLALTLALALTLTLTLLVLKDVDVQRRGNYGEGSR